MDQREWRRKRRRRNQMISYILTAVVLVGAGAGAFAGIRHFMGSWEERGLVAQATESGQAEALPSAASEKPAESPEMSEGAEGTEPAGNQGEAAETENVPDREELLEELVEGCVANMSLEDKVAGLFIVTPEQLTGVGTAIQAGDGTREALAKYPVGGLVYFAKNIKSGEQLKEMLANTVSSSKYPLFLGVDEEGGRVARLADGLNLENVGPMADIGASGDPQAAYETGAFIASYLKEYGFNLDFAPVADVLTNPDNTVIGDRAFGSDPSLTAQMVAGAVKGFQENGVSACLKHFPGHGDTAGDSHSGAVTTERTLEEMQAAEFLPFTAGIEAGVDMVMVGHISAPGLTGGDNLPACMNEKIITDILRKQLGYNGVVITDAMNMAAVSEYYAADEAAVKALKAGADMILMPEDFVAAYEGVVAAVKDGTIDERRIDDSLKRVYRVKYADTLTQ